MIDSPMPDGRPATVFPTQIPHPIDAGELVASLAMVIHELQAWRKTTCEAKQVDRLDNLIIELGTAAHLVALTWAKPLVLK